MRLLPVILALLASPLAIAQSPAPNPQDSPQDNPPQASTLSVQVRVVAIDAVVRNKQTSEPVLDLTQNDFHLRVDGKPVPVRYFTRDNDLPLTVGLLIDTSGSQRTYFEDESLAADVFLRNTLVQPHDRAFLVRFDSQVLLLQKMTSSLQSLDNGLRLLDYTGGPLYNRQSGGTLLYDAIATVSSSVIGKEPGRRALVLLTDGEDNGSRADLAGAIRQAQLADVAIYGVLYTHDVIGNTIYPSTPGHVSGIEAMQKISRATGGRAFVVGTGTPTAQVFAAIAQDLRTQYRLGFTPPDSPPGKQHTIDLRTGSKSLLVQARTGYVTPQ
jgi:VWFA-related protein